VPVGDAACTPPSVGGGHGGPADGGTPDAPLEDVVTTSCGEAEVTIGNATGNTTCTPCIQSSPPDGCCDSSVGCSNDGQCLALLSCIVSCAPGNATCPLNCGNLYPTGITAYDALSQCVDSSCPGCPKLPPPQ
jgi:hypothetical protein